MSLQRENCKEEMQLLIYVMTPGVLSLFEKELENAV